MVHWRPGRRYHVARFQDFVVSSMVLHVAPVPRPMINKALQFHTEKPISFSPGKDSLET